MAFDFKKKYRKLYLPDDTPEIVDVPSMNFIAVSGKGDPNEMGGAYQQAIELLYAVAYTIRMSNRGNHSIDGFFEYVVPPLEGFWWMSNLKGIDYVRKKDLFWISMIRLPDFIKKADLDWAIAEATEKKQKDFSKVIFFPHREGLCVQCMHKGSYDNEPVTIRLMEEYVKNNGYVMDITSSRLHHEIYLSDPRKYVAEILRTVIRLPVKKKD